MSFWLGFVGVNIVCFLPYYLINVRQQSNPFAFLTEKRARHRSLKQLVFSKLEFSDPFRINVEFSLALLILLLLSPPIAITLTVSTAILLLSQVYIIYLSVMLFVFSRTPAFLSDLSLINTGIVVFKHRAIILIACVIGFICLLGFVAYEVNNWLIYQYYEVNYRGKYVITLTVALVILAFSLLDWKTQKKQKKIGRINWRTHRYKDLHWRNAFSTSLHIVRNLMFCQKYKPILQQSKAAFRDKNVFANLKLKQQPNFVFICIESYGARVYKDPKLAVYLESTLHKYDEAFKNAGIHMCSHFSTSPIFSGGSWLSYSTFMYGTKIENIQLHETLFSSTNNFDEYESIFHLLRRNNYHNVLSCPMGGVEDKDIDWHSINRCFKADDIVDWRTLNFEGNKLPFFGLQRRFCAPDQYVINHGYERAKSQTEKPVCMFYCTMNSHIPWISPTAIVEDWRVLNAQGYKTEITTDLYESNHDKYLASIDYQLASVFDFALKNKDDDLVLVVFGDHQPPLIAIPRMGLETPVHVISKNTDFVNAFKTYGFTEKMSLRGHKGNIKHEGFMSLFGNACSVAFGEDTSLSFDILPDGINLYSQQHTNDTTTQNKKSNCVDDLK